LFTEHGAQIDHRDNSGHTPVHYATLCNAQHILRFLVDLGADVNIKTKNGSPINISLSTLSHKTATILLEAGAKVDEILEGGQLHRLAEDGDTRVLKMVLEAATKCKKSMNKLYCSHSHSHSHSDTA
jgi:hypothetical protein